jgi:hypothetical protein
MKPNDENGKLPTSERPFRVLVISGSNRRQYNCPGVDSKARTLMLRMAERLPSAWEIDYEDLGNVFARAHIASCNACVSTSMALCVYPCLPASERVLGKTLKSIASLKVGDEISTGKIEKVWISSPKAQLYKLKLSDGRQVRLTANHPVKVITETKREKVGKEWKYVRYEDWIEAGKLKIGDKIPFPLGEEQCGKFADDSNIENFYFLLAGAVFGDGTFAGQGQVRLFFDKRRPVLAETIVALSPAETNIRPQVFSAKRTAFPRSADEFMSYVCWETSIGRILIEKIGLDKKTNVAERRVPGKVLNGSRAEVCAFLRGWFSADGSVDFHKTKTRVSLTSSSVHALREAQILLAKLGIRSSVYDMSHKKIEMGGKEYSRSSILHIAKAESVALFAETIGFLDEKTEKLKRLVRPPQKEFNRNYGRVVSFEPDGEAAVYDISVTPAHEFVAELVPVHNCNCYEKDSKLEPDLMWDLDMYARLDLADAWAIIAPVNWYAPTSNLKLMFDRLVCMNGGNPREDLIEHKNAELAMKLEHSEEWEKLSQNHLEGRTAAFFCYGDGGGDELDEAGRPKILKHKSYFNPADEPFEEMRQTYAPLVWQCRYGGVEVPDHLWQYIEFGRGKKYSDNQAEHMATETNVFEDFDKWTDAFAEFVAGKGKVEPAEYRAYGYEAPGHFWKDIKLQWREKRIALGFPPEGSSPARQKELGINVDETLTPRKGEGEKLREE